MVLYLRLSDPAPPVHHCPNNPVLRFFWMGWNQTQPNPRRGFLGSEFFFSHTLTSTVNFFFQPPPAPYLPPTSCFSLPSSFPSIFPLIISSSFFGTSSVFVFSFFFFFFLFLFLLFCVLIWSFCDLFVFFFWLFFFFLSCVCVLSSVCGAGEEDYGSNKNKEEREEEEEQYEEQS